MDRNKKSFLSVPSQSLLVPVLLFVLVGGCDRVGDDLLFKPVSTVKPSELTVNVIQVSRDEQAIETAVFFGTLEPNRQSRLGFGRTGRIKKVFKLIGETAAAGEKLVELEQDQLENQKRDVEQKLLDTRQNLQSGEQTLRSAAQQQIPQLESQLREIDLELVKGVIVAPYDCIVAQKNLEVGDLASPSTPALQVVENKGVTVKANLPRKIADALSIGQSVWVGVSDESVSALIRTKSPVETSAGGKSITLQITGELTGAWSYGQTVEIRFFVPTQNSGFWIPLSALKAESNGLWSVLTVRKADAAGGSATENQFEVAQKILEIVQLEDDWALVRGAFADGELVVVSGSHRVVAGQLVKTNDVTSGYKKPGAGVNE